MLNSDFDHMFGLANGFCDQKPERSEMNWPIETPNSFSDVITHMTTTPQASSAAADQAINPVNHVNLANHENHVDAINHVDHIDHINHANSS